ncbi:low-density lipoprotein receptor-related protein 2-like [Mercenaria mercenaria]|uniref:low-density lipoprotein receptor-related protein 2-like n=1 Tax=Mercenaria mercenaria TaxID=6596 RepID=UPI00234FAAF7|nr:low-density lipoprotein receptor-related protein 2-like [Mercenaria mercenaria]
MYRINTFLKYVSFWILMFSLDYAYTRIVHSQETYLDGSKQKCVQLGKKEKVCNVVQAHYNMTTFPNLLGHKDISEAKEEFKDFKPLIDVNCSASLEEFLCLIYFPPCTSYPTTIKVCRSYCHEAVTEECREILKKFNTRPPVLECGQYPLSESDVVCIKPDNTISKNGGTVATATSGSVIFNNFDDESSLESKEEEIDLDLNFLVTSGNNIQLLDIRSTNNMDTITLYRRLPTRMSTTIDYYEPSQYIFWASSTEGKIFRGTLVVESLRNIRPIIDTGSASVESIAVDWNLRVLFWTESVPVARLRTSSLSGRMVTTLLSDDMKYPISLSIDPLEGKLFWIDRRGVAFDQSSSIESYSIVTEEHSTVFNITSLTIVNGGRATALVVDIGQKRIYFVDARSQSLHSIKYDGSDHKVLLSNHPYLKDVDRLVLHEGHILWVDKISRALIWADKATGENERVLKIFDTGPPQNMKIFGKQRQNISSSSYAKSSLAERWQELSSKENMADLETEDDYDYDDYEGQTNEKSKKPKSSANNLTSNYNFEMLLCLVYIVLVL